MLLEISGVEPEITICKIAVLPVKLYPLAIYVIHSSQLRASLRRALIDLSLFRSLINLIIYIVINNINRYKLYICIYIYITIKSKYLYNDK